MAREISRRRFLGALPSLVAGPALARGGLEAFAPAVSPFPAPRGDEIARRALPGVAELLARADLGGKLGYVVADAASGAVLEARNPLLPLPPASVAKVATAAYALETLGANYRFSTRLLARGAVADGRLEGDLILQGGGDPMLTTEGVSELARALKSAGIREISGRFLVDSSALPYLRAIDPEQPEHLGYNPSVCGLNLNYNRVFFQWKRQDSGYAVTMDARSGKFRPQVGIARMRVVERKSPVYTYSQQGVIDRWTVARWALGEGGGRWLPVRRPDLYAGEVFVWLARAYGIVLPGAQLAGQEAQRTGGTLLAQAESPELGEMVRLMLKHSVNLTAEVLGLSASIARRANASTLADSAGAMSGWMQDDLGVRRAGLADHSGLSDLSRLSAGDMVRALMRIDGRLSPMLKEQVALDARGSANPGAGYAIRAKTGSLNFVSSLAGYVQTPAGRPLAFAIFSGDVARRAAIARQDRERPPGARSWGRRDRWVQHRLIECWVRLSDVLA